MVCDQVSSGSSRQFRPLTHLQRLTLSLRWHGGLWLAITAGLILKVAILATGSVTFNADEAILGLMARHILQGKLPVFFYGQSYMGALHSYLLAPSFLVFGQTVFALRVVQIGLYLGVLITTYVMALRLSGDRQAATVAALLMAVPPVMVSAYTTAALGNYVEVLLINNLLLIIGWDVLDGRKPSAGWWLLAGFLAGLGWWGMSLVITAVVPLGLLGVWRLIRSIRHDDRLGAEAKPLFGWTKLIALFIGFVVGALPWLIGMGADPIATFNALFGVGLGTTVVGDSAVLLERVLSFIAFSLPALFGLRPSWSLSWTLLPVGLILTTLYLFVLWRATRRAWSGVEPTYTQTALITLLGGWAVLLVAFVLSPFGIDPTGRYLLPLYPLLAVLVSGWLIRLRRGEEFSLPELDLLGCRAARLFVHQSGPAQASMLRQSKAHHWGATALMVLILGYNLWGNVRAMVENPPGLTTQFDLITHIPHEYDDDLIAFLDALGVDRGYSNYWVAFRFAFLTHERILFSPRLPYKVDLSYSYRDDRYPLYTEAVRVADRVVYVTSNLPDLDALIQERFDACGVAFRRQTIGPYTIFYDLSRPVTPEELGPFGVVSMSAPLEVSPCSPSP